MQNTGTLSIGSFIEFRLFSDRIVKIRRLYPLMRMFQYFGGYEYFVPFVDNLIENDPSNPLLVK